MFNFFRYKKTLNELKLENKKLKQCLDSLNKNKYTLNILASNIDFMFFILDKNLNFEYASPSFYNLSGYSENEIINNNLLKICTPESSAIIQSELQKRISGNGSDNQKKWTFSIYYKNKKIVWLETLGTPIISDKKEFMGVIAFSKRIIDKNKTPNLVSHIEDAIDDKLIQLSTAIEQTPVSIVITDTKGNIEYVNPFFSKTTGYDPEEVIGKNPRVLKSGNTDDLTYKKMWTTISNGEIWYGEFENRKKNGELYLEKASIAPIFDTNNNITSFIAIKEDITQLRKTRNELIESEKELRNLNAKKDKFFSIIAHDLRGPFASIAALIKMLKENYKKYDSKNVEHILGMLDNSASNVLKLTENLLEWARTQTGKIALHKELLVFNEVCNNIFDTLQTVANNKEVQLINLNNEYISFYADKNMIATVIRNIISNAIKYSARNSQIDVKAEIHGEYLQISVKDYGVGIPPEAQEKLFKIDQNYTSIGTEQEKGSGLGLILCKEFIEAHNGKIWYESKPGLGSTFFFIIPKQ